MSAYRQLAPPPQDLVCECRRPIWDAHQPPGKVVDQGGLLCLVCRRVRPSDEIENLRRLLGR